jgi:hypothetical protein
MNNYIIALVGIATAPDAKGKKRSNGQRPSKPK